MFLFIATAQSASKYWPIRIGMEYGYITGDKNDTELCKNFRMDVDFSTWAKKEQCWPEMADYREITPYLIGTAENAKNYIQRLVRVIPRPSPVYVKPNIYVRSTSNIGEKSFLAAPFTEELIVPNIDLHISIVYRPHNDTKYPPTLAFITTIDELGFTQRPLAGLIVATMDKKKYYGTDGKLRVEDENTPNNFIFWGLVKNFIQILGFDKNRFSYYHPKGNNKVFENTMCTIPVRARSGLHIKSYKYLITPNAQKFARRHFGVDKVTQSRADCPPGIELEEGEFSQYGLLEGRTLFGDIMSYGVLNFAYPRITDATAAVLLDTGNYELNWSMIQPHEWGHKESIDGNYIPNFANGNPQFVYPRYYQVNFSNSASEKEKVTGFNFKFVGNTDEFSLRPTNHDGPKLANFPWYFNPKRWKSALDWPIADFAPIKPVMQYCPPYTAILPSEGGPSDFTHKTGKYRQFREKNLNSKAWRAYQCGEYDCRTYDEFKYRLYNNSNRTVYVDIICNNENANVKFKHTVDEITYTMWCPEPERFCRSMNLNHAYFKSNPFEDENDDQEDALPLPTTIPPTVAPSPEPTLEPTPDPTPSAWPTERPPELWTDQPEEMFIPMKTRTPVPPETAIPTEYPEQTDYPKQVITPDQTEFILPTIPAEAAAAAAIAAAKAAIAGKAQQPVYDGSTTIIVTGVIAIIVIIDIAVILNVLFIFKKAKKPENVEDELIKEEFNV